MTVSRRALLTAGAVGGAAGLLGAPPAVAASPASTRSPAAAGQPWPEPIKVPEAAGGQGAVASVDPYASEVGIQVLRSGGNAVDAAIAVAAVLGVVEPFSCGLGGGGFFVYHHARSGRTVTINGRESAPGTYSETEFTDGSGNPLDFDTVVSSGRSVGVPGTLATWQVAAQRFGTRPLRELLRPAEELARAGFVVDVNFRDQVAANADRFRLFPETVRLFMPGGRVPEPGSTLRNDDLAETYRLIRRRGTQVFYHGPIARAIVEEVTHPTTAAGVHVPPGRLTLEDLAGYRAPVQEPIRSGFRGLDVLGMGLPSSGGVAVGQILNLMTSYAERFGTALSDLSEADCLHRFSEACAIAFADRNRYLGDVPDVPVGELLSRGYARERALSFDPARAQPRPVPFGSPDGDYTDTPAGGLQHAGPPSGGSTTHFNVVDRWGGVVSYTFTIEQTGGSGITVPGSGFLLNNELTDFNFVPLQPGVPDPNLPGPGKRPRSSMSPTILLEDGRPRLSVGTPGGATIITSVAQILLGHLERGLPLVDAISAPRLSSRNGPEDADLGLDTSEVGAALVAQGHRLTPQKWIGNASGITVQGRRLVAAAETVRGGGGAARVVDARP